MPFFTFENKKNNDLLPRRTQDVLCAYPQKETPHCADKRIIRRFKKCRTVDLGERSTDERWDFIPTHILISVFLAAKVFGIFIYLYSAIRKSKIIQIRIMYNFPAFFQSRITLRQDCSAEVQNNSKFHDRFPVQTAPGARKEVPRLHYC